MRFENDKIIVDKKCEFDYYKGRCLTQSINGLISHVNNDPESIKENFLILDANSTVFQICLRESLPCSSNLTGDDLLCEIYNDDFELLVRFLKDADNQSAQLKRCIERFGTQVGTHIFEDIKDRLEETDEEGFQLTYLESGKNLRCICTSCFVTYSPASPVYLSYKDALLDFNKLDNENYFIMPCHLKETTKNE